MEQIDNPLLQSKIPSLDGLRAISIFFVIICHLSIDTRYEAYLRPLGSVGVEIFFVISGFLITTLLLKERQITGHISLKNFYIRRFLRIIPLVFLFLVILLILNAVFNLNITSLSFLTSFLFIKNLPIPGVGEWQSGHLWSLGIEEQFYLIFPFVLSYLTSKRYMQLIVLLILFIPTLTFLFFSNMLGSNKIIHVIAMVMSDVFGKGTTSILIGSLASSLLIREKNFFNTKIYNNAHVSYVIFFLAIFIRLIHNNTNLDYLTNALFSVLIAFFIVLNLNDSNIAATILNNRILSRFGVLSFSIYIWQQLFTHQMPWANSFSNSDSKIFNMLCLAIVSCLSYYLYEKQFLKLKNKYKIVR